MIQPKYNPKEALEKIKLNMKYDTSKTLNENQQLLMEGVVLIGIGVVMAAGALYTWLSNVSGGGDSIEKTKRLLEGCPTVQKGVRPTLDTVAIGKVARDIYDGVSEKTLGVFTSTDEEKVKKAFESLPTIGDICAVKIEYEAKYGDDLFDDLDSDFDGEEFRKYVWLPIMDIVEKTNQVVKQEVEKDPKKEDEKTDNTPKSRFSPCEGTYKFLCYSPVIAKVQGCLGGLVQDGKFGEKTQGRLDDKFPQFVNSFTDSDVATICGGSQEITVSDEESVDDVNSSNY